MIKPKLFLELPVRLFADPSRLDRRGECLECGVCRQVRKVVFLLSGLAPFAHQPDLLLTGHGLDANVAHAVPVAICDSDPAGSKSAGQLAFGLAPPADRLPFRLGQPRLGRGCNAVRHMIFAPPAGRSFREYQSDIRLIHILAS